MQIYEFLPITDLHLFQETRALQTHFSVRGTETLALGFPTMHIQAAKSS